MYKRDSVEKWDFMAEDERASSNKTTGGMTLPDTEVVERAVKRTFTAEYKQRILREADRCKPGELGALP